MRNNIKGIHFYININNLNNMVRKDENKNDDLLRTFHQLQTYVSSLEKFAKELINVQIEKVTYSRIHFFVEGIDIKSINEMFELIYFAYRLCVYMKNEIGKYEKLPQLVIGVGADEGNFTIYEYNDENIIELTTIGSPANRAAKLQSLCSDSKILISKELFEILGENEKGLFVKDIEKSVKLSNKYEGLVAFTTDIKELKKVIPSSYYKKESVCFLRAKEIANNNMFQDICFSDAKKQIDFTDLSLKQSKDISEALVLYADIRGFTNKVDQSKLNYIKTFVKEVLQKMHSSVIKEKGTHVKFQGDRESAVFNKDSNLENYIERGIFAAMRMIDFVKEMNSQSKYDEFEIGIGCSIGEIYATRIGMRGKTYNVILGQTEREADYIEDNIAGNQKKETRTEIVISNELYNKLKPINSMMAGFFHKKIYDNQIYWSCTSGLKEYQQKRENERINNNYINASKNSLRPWGIKL